MSIYSKPNRFVVFNLIFFNNVSMVFHFNSSIVLNILSHKGEGDFSTGLGIEIRSPPPSLPKIKLNSKVVQRLNEMILI